VLAADLAAVVIEVLRAVLAAEELVAALAEVLAVVLAVVPAASVAPQAPWPQQGVVPSLSSQALPLSSSVSFLFSSRFLVLCDSAEAHPDPEGQTSYHEPGHLR
jgi:hypothetical protein